MIDELLKSKPRGLRARANEAAAQANEERLREIAEECETLAVEAYEFLREALDMPHDELAGIEFEQTTITPTKAAVWFTIEGLEFRAHHVQEKVMTVRSSEFAPEDIYEDVLRVEVKQGPHMWKRVTDLVSLGKLSHV